MKTRTKINCSIIDHNSIRICGIIVAAGAANRFGGRIPKQFLPLAGIPVFLHSLRAFLSHSQCERCVVVCAPTEIDRVRSDIIEFFPDLLDRTVIVAGGLERAESVANGVKTVLDDDVDAVFIHDAARPGLSHDVLDRLLAGLSAHHGSAPALPVVDALKRSSAKGFETIERKEVYRIQTPQAIRTEQVNLIYSNAELSNAVDDFQLAEAAGLSLTLVEGDEKLSKLTYQQDFAKLEHVLFNQNLIIRTGLGYDVHAFEPGDSVQLCGVPIRHTHKLKGHSDADVAWHALTDALLGALALGDIGDHFPPSDPQWKGSASSIFLKFAADKVRELGGTISNLDVTIVCEAPKVKPHREAMRQATADIVGIDVSKVSVKATTTEALGFEGRREGISSQAIATIALPSLSTGF